MTGCMRGWHDNPQKGGDIITKVKLTARNGLPPQNIMTPTNPPQNRDRITFLLLIARITATIGGNRLNTP